MRLSVIVSATVWACAVRLWTVVLFERPSNMAAAFRLSWSALPAISFLCLALRFLTTSQIGPTDARLTRIAGWISAVLLILILITPIAYGLIVIYLLMSPAGILILGGLVMASVGLLRAGSILLGRLREPSGTAVPHATRLE